MAKKKQTAPTWDATDPDGFRTSYALTYGVSQLLRSPAVQKISFMFGAVIVSGSRMLELARAIENFEVLVYQDTKCKKVPSAFDGYYSGNDDVIYLGFKDLTSMDNRMVLVHECVHAINDIHGSAGLSQLDDECAGYVACAQYYRHSGNAWPTRAKATAALVDAIYEAAFSLADDYLDKVMNPTMGVETLRAAVLAHPIYAGVDTKKMTYNGLDHRLRSKAFRLLTGFLVIADRTGRRMCWRHEKSPTVATAGLGSRCSIASRYFFSAGGSGAASLAASAAGAAAGVLQTLQTLHGAGQE